MENRACALFRAGFVFGLHPVAAGYSPNLLLIGSIVKSQFSYGAIYFASDGK
jgi:hypothetical protein